MKETPSDQLRIGLIATDPLRVLGLQTIFAEDGRTEVISLSVPGALDASGVSLILIDAACTDHLFELLETFRRSRPHLRVDCDRPGREPRVHPAGDWSGSEGIPVAYGPRERDTAGDRDCARRIGVGSA